MNSQTLGTVISVKKQWWFKVNTKNFRRNSLDGATFPHIIKVSYTVNGKEFIKRKWVSAGFPVPPTGSAVTVAYCDENPKKSKIL